MEKTLGGDRLGSGKKMKVHLHGYERSTHDMGYVWRSTMSAGTLVPFLCEVALPGDTFDINLGCDIKTPPTTGPLFGSYKAQLDIFQAPIRLYNALLHNNQLGIGLNMATVKLPKLELTAQLIPTGDENTDWDNLQINPSCVLNYLGIRGVGNPGVATHTRKFNGVPFLALWEIYKNYYSNKQEEIGAVIHSAMPAIVTPTSIDIIRPLNTDVTLPALPSTLAIPTGLATTFELNYTGTPAIPNQIIISTSVGDLNLASIQLGNAVDNGSNVKVVYNNSYGNITLYGWRVITSTDIQATPPQVVTFDLNNIDTMRQNILAAGSTEYIINTADLEPYNFIYDTNSGFPTMLSSQEGLPVKTYQSDLFNNWLSTEWIDGTGGITEITAIDTSGGSFTLDTLNLSKKVYDMLNRIAVSGGTYDDWLDAVYDHPRYLRCESPMYCGGLIKELVFQEVVSNSQTEEQPLGTLAGKGVMANKHKGGEIIIKVDEPSYIIGLISLTPRIDYSQGNKWDVHLDTLDDLHKPALDEIGFQELITEQLAWFDTRWDTGTSSWVQKSAGKQPAWMNYMTNVNRCYGNFAIPNNQMWMTLNRKYEYTTGTSAIADLTTYIDPAKYNSVFAEETLDAQNFWAQISVDMITRRKMSARLMPNL